MCSECGHEEAREICDGYWLCEDCNEDYGSCDVGADAYDDYD